MPLVDLREAPAWRLVLQALENERCLDLQYRAANPRPVDHAGVPNYKVMKQWALQSRFGILYAPLILAAQFAVIALVPWQWLRAMVLGAAGRDRGQRLQAIATAPANVKLIRAALGASQVFDEDLMTVRRLSAGIGMPGVLRSMLAHGRLLWHIARLPAPLRRDLLLHARDALALIMLVLYARRHPQQAFITDDHYQRWAYLLSHCADDVSIVQHGFLDATIGFDHPFGTLASVYVRDCDFEQFFLRYYTVRVFRLFGGMAELQANAFAPNVLFLASSFPSIDSEIAVLEQVRAHSSMPIIVKFHPSHAYDDRRRRLAALADHICPHSDYPACAVFVSHSSFMEYDYRALGIPTFSIARDGGADATAAAILACLAMDGAPAADG